jgi:hypothetical protein
MSVNPRCDRAAADRELLTTTAVSFEPRQAAPNSALRSVVAFTGVLASNFVTGESVPQAVTLLVSCLGDSSAANEQSQHSKQQSTSKASLPHLFSIAIVLTISESVQCRELLGSRKTQD